MSQTGSIATNVSEVGSNIGVEEGASPEAAAKCTAGEEWSPCDAAAEPAANEFAAGGETVEATASFLKTSKNPVAYLAGVDISLIHKDYDLASQVDWSHIPNPLDPGVFKNDYVPSFEQLPSEIASNLAGVF